MGADTDRFPIVELDAIRTAGKRRVTRRFGRLMLVALLVTPLLLAFAPWQQNLAGQGRVIAFDPVERPMPLQARTDGVLLKWHVQEGQHVAAGAPIVDLADNDPQILLRLQEQLTAAEQKLSAAKGKREQYVRQVEEAEQARVAAMQLADDEIAAAEQAVVVAQQSVKVARENVRFREIAETMWSGLVADRIGASIELENARQQLAIARAELESRLAAVVGA
jgi:adhesin transport system membrane fusion protein